MEVEWRKIKPSLGQALSHIFQTGLYSDLTFRVGPQLQEFKAHKVVVMSRSEVFALMLQDRWEAGGVSKTGDHIIDIPHSDPKSFGYFLKYLYSDDFEDPASVEVILQVLILAHLYQVQSLVSKACELLTSNINLQNCVEIYQATRFYSDQEIQLSHPAFDFMTRNINDFLNSPSFLALDRDGLAQLLQSDNMEVDESELFKAVLKWSEYAGVFGLDQVPIAGTHPNNSETSEIRKIQLQSLIPLIRFPLMGAEKFREEVVPSKVLSDKTVMDLFVHFNGGHVDDLTFSIKHRVPKSLEATNLPSHFKRLKCFDNELPYRYDHTILIFGISSLCSPENDLRFSVNTAITVQGLSFYGFRLREVPANSKRSNTAEMPRSVIYYESITVKIYRYDRRQITYDPRKSETVMDHKWSKVIVSEGNELNLLFVNPVKIIPGFTYFIRTALKIKKDYDLMENAYHFNIGNFIQRERHVRANPLTMTLKFENITAGPALAREKDPIAQAYLAGTQQSRSIHSIIYTIG